MTSGVGFLSYGPATLWCWQPSHTATNDVAWINRMIYYGVYWICMLAVAIIMTMMYSKVLAQERKMEKYRTNTTTTATTTGTERSNDQKQQREKIKASRQIANQAAFWIGAFLLSYIFGFIVRLMEMIEQYSAPDAPWVLFAIFTPLQGFLNSLVYFRPIYMSKYPDSIITACLTCRCDRWTSPRFINNSNGVRGETNDPSGTQEIDPTQQDNHGNSEEEKIEETADCLEEGVNRS